MSLPCRAWVKSLIVIASFVAPGAHAAPEKAFSPEVIAATSAATALVVTTHGSGTGFVVAIDGGRLRVLTNHHVIQRVGEPRSGPVFLVFGSGERPYPVAAHLVDDDPELDLALLDAPALPGVRAVALGAPAAGEVVIAAGFPFGLTLNAVATTPSPSFTTGSIESVARDPSLPSWQMLVDVIVNPGNSGGPIVDARGRAVGVTVAHRPRSSSTIAIRHEAVVEFLARTMGRVIVSERAPTVPARPPAHPGKTLDEQSLLEGLPLVQGSRGSGVAAVVGVRGDRVLLLAAGPVADALGEARAAVIYRSRSEQERVAGGITLLRRLMNANVALYAADLPRRLEVRALSLAPGGRLAPTTPVRVAVAGGAASFRNGRLARAQRNQDGDFKFLQLDLGIGETPTGGPVLSPVGDLVGFVAEAYEGGGVTVATPGEVISKDASGRPVGGEIQVRVSEAGRCRLEARVDLDDPLGTFRRVTLAVAPPRWVPAFPRRREELGTIGSALATAVPTAGRAALAADVPCADRYHAQLGIEGEREQWLSIPYGLGGGPGTGRRAVAGERAWRRGVVGLSWPRGAPAPATGSVPHCLPPADVLDPDTIYVIGGASGRCAGTTFTPVDGGSPRCAAIGLGRAVAISPHGRLLYKANMEDGDVYRLHAGDVPEGSGRLAHCLARWPELNDEIVFIDACGSRATAGVAFTESEALTECDGRWSQVDGATVETYGGQLIRGGRRGRLLLSPWSSLAVVGPSGTPIEVSGLPGWATGESLVASTATPDGFLVALGGRERALELFAIDPTGRASARGTYPELPHFQGAAVLDGRGRLHVISRGKALRLEPGGTRAVTLADGLDLVTGFASAPGPRAGRWPREREVYLGSPAARIYQAPPGARLACAASLDAFDPGHVYVAGGQDRSHPEGEPPAVFDAADPSRRVYGLGIHAWQRSVITPDGHLLHLDDDGTLREFRPDAARANARTGRCGLVQGLAESDPSVAAACPRVADFAVAPSSGVLALSCSDPATGQTWASLGGHRFPSVKAGRVFAGDGLLLVQEHEGARILSTDGKARPVRGLPAAILAARATRDGFDVVIMPWASPKPRVERWHVGADGIAAPAGAYRLDNAPLRIALQEDGTILAQCDRRANTIVRAFTDGRPEELLWVGRDGGPLRFAFATGP